MTAVEVAQHLQHFRVGFDAAQVGATIIVDDKQDFAVGNDFPDAPPLVFAASSFHDDLLRRQPGAAQLDHIGVHQIRDGLAIGEGEIAVGQFEQRAHQLFDAPCRNLIEVRLGDETG